MSNPQNAITEQFSNVESSMNNVLKTMMMVMAAAGALASLVAPAHAIISIDPCSASGNTRFTPGHPGPSDNIELYSTVWPNDVAPKGSLVVAAANVAGDGSILLDVIITTDPKRFPSYRIVGDHSKDRYAILPPLAPGTYEVGTQVRYDEASAGRLTLLCPVKTFAMNVAAVPAATMRGSVIEYYNAALDHFFITQSAREIADLDSGVHLGWVRTGNSFAAYLPTQSDHRGRMACRSYGLPSAQLDTHFQSVNQDECHLMWGGKYGPGWVFEAWNVFEIAMPDTLTGDCPYDTAPVYRLWNGRIDSNHRYTTSSKVRAQMIATGYLSEGYGDNGVVMCAVSGGT